MFCNNCGSKNSDGAKFCQKCGNQLSHDVQYGKNSDNSNQYADESFVNEKEFIFTSFKFGGASRFRRFTNVICNKNFIKIVRNYKPSLKNEPDEIINTQEVKTVNYKLYINPVSLILSILAFILLLIYEGFIYAILALAIMIVYCSQTKICIFTSSKTYTILCGMFGGRAQAKKFADSITKEIK